MSDRYYCDDYEAITGRQRDDSAPVEGDSTISSKVIEPPALQVPAPSGVQVETK